MLLMIWEMATSAESDAIASWLMVVAIMLFTRKIDPHTKKMYDGMANIKKSIESMDDRIKTVEGIVNTDVPGRPGEKLVWKDHP